MTYYAPTSGAFGPRKPMGFPAPRKPKAKPRPGVDPASLKPPAGLYDPSLDSALGQVNRGFGDQKADYVRDYGVDGKGGRAFNDFQIASGDINDQAKQARQDFATQRGDINRGFTQNVSDVNVQGARARSDFDTAMANIGRQFEQQGQAQAQSAGAAGVGSGGALAQALRKRQANQAVAEQPTRTAFLRQSQDQQTTLSRLADQHGRDLTGVGVAEDRAVGSDPNAVGGALGKQLAALGLGYSRNVQDAGTGLLRAQRENSQFGLDTQAQRLYQATGQGYVIPGKRRPRIRSGQTGSGVRY